MYLTQVKHLYVHNEILKNREPEEYIKTFYFGTRHTSVMIILIFSLIYIEICRLKN